MNLVEIKAAYVLGYSPDTLQDTAVRLIEEGFFSPNFGILAGEPNGWGGYYECSLFEAGLKDHGETLPTRVEAAYIMRRYFAEQVATGEIHPKIGAKIITEDLFWEVQHTLSRMTYYGEAFGIARLVGLYYSYDDVDSNDEVSIAWIDGAIIEECSHIASIPAG